MMLRLLVLMMFIEAAAAQDRAVVRYYGESLCPFCRDAVSFVATSVFDRAHAGIDEILDFQYVAWGNAQRLGGTVVCEHGPVECLGNAAEECARNQTAYNPTRYMKFVGCIEVDYATIDAAAIASCARAASLDDTDIAACIADGRGDALAAAAEKATPPHPGVPWVTFNGAPMDDYTTIVADACRYWTGAKPAFCAR